MESGNPSGQPILFLHGISQCSFAWERQLDSDLGRTHRLVAMDLRGHGASGRPVDGYGDSALWAADVSSAMHALDLQKPILCGWSYGALVVLDYIRHHGEDEIGGVHLVDAITKLGSEAATAVLTPEFLSVVPGFFSSDVGESVRSLESLLRMCVASELSSTDRYTMLGYNVSVSPFVRQAMFARVLDNDDLLPAIRTPVLITHGAADAIVKKEVVAQHQRGMAHAQVHVMEDAGHAPFWDDAAVFNQRLGIFCDEVARTSGSPLADDLLAAR